MEENKVNLIPLRYIRIAKDYNTKQMADCFGVSSTMICAAESGNKKMSLNTLTKGLNNLGVTLSDYIELEELGEALSKQQTDDITKYRCMLAKALGIVAPELKEQVEELLQEQLHYMNRKAETTYNLGQDINTNSEIAGDSKQCGNKTLKLIITLHFTEEG